MLPGDNDSAIAAQLSVLHRRLRGKLAEHSQLLKDAEKQQSDSAIMARAQATCGQVQELHRQFGEVLEAGERSLREQGFDLGENGLGKRVGENGENGSGKRVSLNCAIFPLLRSAPQTAPIGSC